jgi:hypothetical protein
VPVRQLDADSMIADPAAVAAPPLYMAFDVLYRDGRELTACSLRDCRVAPSWRPSSKQVEQESDHRAEILYRNSTDRSTTCPPGGVLMA